MQLPIQVEQVYGQQDMHKSKEKYMEWLYKDKNCTQEDIKKIEEELKVTLPEEFKDLIMNNNGVYPKLNQYKFNRDEKIVQALLSCKETDDNNIIRIAKQINILGLVPFMSDPFGNYICFQFGLDDNYQIVFYDHETGLIKNISKNFNDFINNLY